MLKIKYPTGKKLDTLLGDYAMQLAASEIDIRLADFFANETPNLATPPTFTKLISMPLEQLFDESLRVNAHLNSHQKTSLKKLINYDCPLPDYGTKKQPTIAKFFADHDDELTLGTCYYCNIDYIHAFSNIGDYKDDVDFVNHALKSELMLIKGIGEKKAQTIINLRQQGEIQDMSSLPILIKRDDKANIRSLVVTEKSSHFTLDHVLDKGTYPLAALSFYNLVPSCYPCNSKFKGSEPLITHTSQICLSPTSHNHSFETDFKFKLLFMLGDDNNLHPVDKLEDIRLSFDYPSTADYEAFLRIFRLRARYLLHKREAISLIKKKKMYDDSYIAKIATTLGLNEDKFRSDIFGDQLFEGEAEEYPLTKLKRDIAKQIGIKNVK